MESVPYNRESSKLFEHYSKSRKDNEKITIEWKDLNYSMLAKDVVKSTIIAPVYRNKRILRSMQGKVSSGELLAIMGPTGRCVVCLFERYHAMYVTYLQFDHQSGYILHYIDKYLFLQ